MKHFIRSAGLALLIPLLLAACGGGHGPGTRTVDAVDPAPVPSDPPAVVSDRPIVATAEGAVVGVRKDTTASFLGLPYAQAPTGEGRFAPPRPAPVRTAALDASAYGAACPQPASGGEAHMAEDCLFLNVWTPADADPTTKLPVLVYIHGGAFTLGSGAQDFSTVSQRGVVVVSLNYRLGALGYLANAGLRVANRDGTLGNFAVMDQLAALAWVQRNIEAFGGDKGRVTVWGTSAGAGQSFALLQSPKAKGLFHRAVMQSGGAAEYTIQPAASSLATGDAAVAAMGCADVPDAAACLRALPIPTLLGQTNRRWRPTVDAQVITQTPARAFATGNFNQVPVMIGGVFDEGTYFVDPTLPAEAYPYALRALAPAGYDTRAIEAAYPLSRFAVPAQGLARAMGDAMYGCGNSARRDDLAAWVPVYGWEMSDPALSQREGIDHFYLGSLHGLDSFYFTETIDAMATLPYRYIDPDAGVTASPDRKELARQMLGYLVNFVQTGDPNGDGRNVPVRWPRFMGPGDRALMNFTLPASRVSSGEFERVHHCDSLWGPAVFPPLY
jgi:para-nitrobenzyl esterase